MEDPAREIQNLRIEMDQLQIDFRKASRARHYTVIMVSLGVAIQLLNLIVHWVDRIDK